MGPGGGPVAEVSRQAHAGARAQGEVSNARAGTAGMEGVSALRATRRLKSHTLLFGEGSCLVWHIYVLESRLKNCQLWQVSISPGDI